MFDPIWYLGRYPAVAQSIADGVWRSALEHYCCNDTPTEFDPLPDFSEDWYLARNPALKEIIAAGDPYRSVLLYRMATAASAASAVS